MVTLGPSVLIDFNSLDTPTDEDFADVPIAIDKLRSARRALASDIRDLVDRFEKRTGTMVDDVNVEHVRHLSGVQLVGVEVKVRLP